MYILHCRHIENCTLKKTIRFLWLVIIKKGENKCQTEWNKLASLLLLLQMMVKGDCRRFSSLKESHQNNENTEHTNECLMSEMQVLFCFVFLFKISMFEFFIMDHSVDEIQVKYPK